jgi:hypothetical protein
MFRKIQESGQSSYLKKLSYNPYWESVKRLVRMRANYVCENKKCAKKGMHETHHSTYVVNGKSIVGHELEYLEYMFYLCGECHAAVHKKKLFGFGFF